MNDVATQPSNKKPASFYFCSISFTFERMAYYSAKWLLYIFLTYQAIQGGLGLDKGQAAMLQANLVAYTYLAPVFGGLIADRFVGARYLIPLGAFIMGIGYYIGSIATGVGMIHLMVFLVAVGTGLFKGNLSAITGQLFNDKKELDTAFSVQYSFVNIGSLIGTTIIPIIVLNIFKDGDAYGFSEGFLFAAIICFICGIWFILGWKFLGDAGKRPFKEGIAKEEKVEIKKPLTTIEKKRVGAIFLISLFSIIFWLFWYMSYLSVYDYMDSFIQNKVGSYTIPTAWFDSLNGLWCIVLGPILGILWLKLANRAQGDMSLFKKLGIGLLFLGSSYLMLIAAELQRGVGASDSSKASMIWIILFSILLSLGEMFFSPLGNSFITKYSPKSILSVMMGVWTVATFIAGKGYGYMYAFVLKFDMMQAYIGIPIVLIVAACLLFIFNKKLITLVEDEDPIEE
ncbi:MULTISPECIES: peptide MFS transporter [Vagococcus]|uniref:Di-/tripeptide transporter n=1 Tax=Vagococcus fluvialis bH819 TaxID=1255619 RepID=A0A1X6WQC0_9ENTE|nr:MULTISPECIES: peptide MFS transporter [Vagococcus]SLM86533.1 Di-/tripeptide transporter [Vagococcus fluvialis bH819]HCM90740.1 MFS transporter [Vagococcus sp.]